MSNRLPAPIRRVIRRTAKLADRQGYARGYAAAQAELSQTTSGDGVTPEQKKLLLYVMLAVQERAHIDGTDPEDTLHELADLAHDPKRLADALSSGADLSWVRAVSKTGKVKAVWTGDGQSRKHLYGDRAERALLGQQKRADKSTSLKHAIRLTDAAMFGHATPDDFRELAHHLPTLTVDQLRGARAKLGASFGNATRRDEMARALLEHVAARVEGLERPENLDDDETNVSITSEDADSSTPMVPDDRLESGSGEGQGGGVGTGGVAGDASPTPDETVPGSGEGASSGGDLRGVSESEGGGRDAGDGSSVRRGDGSPGGEGDSDGGLPAAATGRGGSAGGVGNGSGDGGRDGGDRAASESLAAEPTPENPTDLTAGNFHYAGRDFVPAGAKAKFDANIAAIRTLREIQLEGRTTATPEEQEILSKYVGWGQFKGIFNEYRDPQYNWEESQKWDRERQILKGLLSPEEWAKARGSILNAHYTAPDVVDAHWKIAERLGFKGGRFLETSAGIGYYLGMMPPDIAAQTRSAAVELDDTTGAMLKMLYPSANVQVQGFEKHQAPDHFYDLIASNVPFGDYKVNDKRYNKHQANIHDYFFLKSMDKVRPGGLVMHITSTGTMDKGDPKVRAELAKNADLVGAIRFPGGAHKGNAGTEVVTDMLIFRKRLPGEAPGDQSWLQTTTIPDPAGGEPIPVNKYFADNPDQILGTLDRTGSMYKGNSVNVSKTADYEDRLNAAINRLPQNVMSETAAPKSRFSPAAMPAPGETKVGGFVVKGGKAYVKEDGQLVEQQQVTGKAMERLSGQLEVRDAARALFNDQLAGRDPTASRAKLNAAYDAFVKAHGFISERANRAVIGNDPDAPVLLALEKWDAKAKKATKSDIFHKNTISAVAPVTHVNNVGEGIGVTLHEKGRVDVDHIAQLMGRDRAYVEKELSAQGLAYHDPSEGWQPASHYLAGKVRQKLVLARAAAATDPKYAANVAALEKVQPADVDHTEIDVKMGAPWVPPHDFAEFAAFLTGGSAGHFNVGRLASTGNWLFDFSKDGNRRLGHTQGVRLWSTDRASFDDVMQAALNNQPIVIRDKVGDETIVNRTATDDANAKVQEVKDQFREWVWEDPERRTRLHRFYNDNFNNIRHMSYDGSHLKLPGSNPAIQLRGHQKDFVWQVVTTGKGLAGHEVGTGKTYSMIAAAMELRRLGLARKPAIACLKANVEAITHDALKLYPGARILSTDDMFDAKSRKKTMSRIATGDYDMIIMTHDHLDLLKMKPEVERKYIEDEVAELVAAREAAYQEDPKKGNRIVAQIEKQIKNLTAKLEKAVDSEGKDDAVYFEETGIDHLFVDEAHKYKSLPCVTKQGRVKGIPTQRSNRATNMHMRTRWLMEQNGGRGVVFATGTPVANTMGELYNMQRYLQHEDLRERGIDSFDAWANMFGDIQTKVEVTATGEYKPVSRFSRFVNIPELMQSARQVIDVQKAGAGGVKIVRPVRTDHAVVAPRTPKMDALMASLKARAEAIKSRGGKAEKGMDNMLSVCTDGRKGSVDMRLLDPNLPDDPNSKTNHAVRNVLDIAKERPGVTQMIFCDIGVNPGKKTKDSDDDGGDDTSDLDAAMATDESKFHLYGDIIEKLVNGGIPREQIADFSKLDGAKKEAAIKGMADGTIRVAIGSTDKLGTGVNAQHKLAALHHLDVPWVPASVEQRDGRGWRQGNLNDPTKPADQQKLDVFRYVSEGSLDQMFWQIIANKTKFIKQVMTPGESVGRVAQDEDSEEVSPEQLMAAASGDSRVMEKVAVDEDVKALEKAAARHDREQKRLADSIASGVRNVELLKRMGANAKADAATLAANPDFAFKIDGQTHTDRKSATEAFEKAKAVRDPYGYGTRVGEFRGLGVYKKGENYFLRGAAGDEYPVSDSLKSIEWAANNRVPNDAQRADDNVAQAEDGLAKARAMHGKAFPKADELAEKKRRSKQLEAALTGKEYKEDEVSPKGKTAAAAAAAKAGQSPLDAFENSGKLPEDITQQEWVDLQRAHRRHLGQDETSGTSYAPYADYKEFHRDAVQRAIAKGQTVPANVMADYPEMANTPAPAPAEKPKSSEKTATYKGKAYRVLYAGPTKYGRRARLQYMDGSKDFWVDAKDANLSQMPDADLSLFGLVPNRYDTERASGRVIPAGAGWTARVGGEWRVYTDAEAAERVMPDRADLSLDTEPQAWKSHPHDMDAGATVVRRTHPRR